MIGQLLKFRDGEQKLKERQAIDQHREIGFVLAQANGNQRTLRCIGKLDDEYDGEL